MPSHNEPKVGDRPTPETRASDVGVASMEARGMGNPMGNPEQTTVTKPATNEEYIHMLEEMVDKNNKVRNEKILDMDSWLTFYGIWIAEGWCDKHSESKNIYKVIISVNKQRVKD